MFEHPFLPTSRTVERVNHTHGLRVTGCSLTVASAHDGQRSTVFTAEFPGLCHTCANRIEHFSGLVVPILLQTNDLQSKTATPIEMCTLCTFYLIEDEMTGGFKLKDCPLNISLTYEIGVKG